MADPCSDAAMAADRRLGAVYRRRLAIWLTACGPFHAPEVARQLNVSVDAVGQWVRRYNAMGPGALDGEGRGGRRDSYLSLAEERAVLRSVTRQALVGQVLTAKHVLPALRRAVGRDVSLSYAYQGLHRHH